MIDSLGNRIKGYESNSKLFLTRRMPLIIRLDGKGFSKYTKKFEKPWDTKIKDAFIYATNALFKEVQGLKVSYQQSDELTLLLTNYVTLSTDGWFDNNLQKIVSVSSSILTASFNKYMFDNKFTENLATFDSRAFVVPKEEVCNVFLWRQNDATRNSISCLGQKYFSHKQLHKKSTKEVQEMLMTKKQINWNKLDNWEKNGYCMYRESFEKDPGVIRSAIVVDYNIPLFSQERNFINKFVYLDEK